jgi:hypothetical protein
MSAKNALLECCHTFGIMTQDEGRLFCAHGVYLINGLLGGCYSRILKYAGEMVPSEGRSDYYLTLEGLEQYLSERGCGSKALGLLRYVRCSLKENVISAAPPTSFDLEVLERALLLAQEQNKKELAVLDTTYLDYTMLVSTCVSIRRNIPAAVLTRDALLLAVKKAKDDIDVSEAMQARIVAQLALVKELLRDKTC